VAGSDRLVCLGLDTGGDAHEHAIHAGRRGARDLLERVEDDERSRRRAQLVVALVVAVHDQPRRRDARAESELELTQGGDVRADAELGEKPEDRDVGEGFRAVDEVGVGCRFAIRPHARSDRVLAVDDERRAVLFGERRRGHTADREPAVLDRGRVREDLEHGRIVTVRGRFVISLPERGVRAVAAVLGGAVQETAQLALPRLVRRSRFYEATAKNLLRVAIELVGGVDAASVGDEPPPRELAMRKGAGNVVELGSIAAFGFSPLWLLAAASDIAHGSRTYLDALVLELKAADVLAEEAEFGSVDELLGALERGSGRAARLVDIPPLEFAELRRSVAELRADAESLPSQDDLAAVFRALRRTADRERRPLLEVSAGVGLAFLTCTRKVGGDHVVAPYREDWRPLRREGFAAYARRVARPYGDAAQRHFDPERRTHTDRFVDRLPR
jgi:hypothetical protein